MEIELDCGWTLQDVELCGLGCLVLLQSVHGGVQDAFVARSLHAFLDAMVDLLQMHGGLGVRLHDHVVVHHLGGSQRPVLQLLLELEVLLVQPQLLDVLLVLVLRCSSILCFNSDEIALIEHLLAILNLENGWNLRGQPRILLALRKRNEPRMWQLRGGVDQSRESILARVCFERCISRAGLLLGGSQHHRLGYGALDGVRDGELMLQCASVLGKVDNLLLLVRHLGEVVLFVDHGEQVKLLVQARSVQLFVAIAFVDRGCSLGVNRFEWIACCVPFQAVTRLSIFTRLLQCTMVASVLLSKA